MIVNGGMSKFYMVTDRLKEFFGFDPIVALDPDQAVGRGAAVYHYYLHKHEGISDDMKMLGDAEVSQTAEGRRLATSRRAIEWGSNILNDCLYLGVKNGAVHEIIPTGAKLPYTSAVMTGFSVEPGQNTIVIPIKSRNLDGSYRVIARGTISFKQPYRDGAYVAFRIFMGSNKVINMKAWTSRDVSGCETIEEGASDISIDNSEKTKVKAKLLAPSGSMLQPKHEINNLIQLSQNYERCKSQQEKSALSRRIAASANSICNAGNKNEFAEAVLDALSSVSSEMARQKLFGIARRIGAEWSEYEKRRLASECMDQIIADMNGFLIRGPKVTTNIAAIYTLSICASRDQLRKLDALHGSQKYLQACLYTHAKTRSSLKWLQDKFEEDVNKSKRRLGNNIQFSAYAIGVALRKDGLSKEMLSPDVEGRIVTKLCEVIQMGSLSDAQLTICILALGWICDQRACRSALSGNAIQKTLDTIRGIDDYYPAATVMKHANALKIVTKMVNGELLSVDEEQFLLTKLEE